MIPKRQRRRNRPRAGYKRNNGPLTAAQMKASDPQLAAPQVEVAERHA